MEVARQRNFSRVAKTLHLTQPAVTQQVRALERGLGVRLVDLVGRRLALTEAGTFLATRARTILESVDLLELEMSEFASAR